MRILLLGPAFDGLSRSYTAWPGRRRAAQTEPFLATGGEQLIGCLQEDLL